MFPDHFIADGCTITQHVAENLVALRNRYAYPRAHARFSVDSASIRLSATRSAELVHPEPGHITDLELDRYHAGLLHSDDPIENLLGTLSTGSGVSTRSIRGTRRYAPCAIATVIAANPHRRRNWSPDACGLAPSMTWAWPLANWRR
jgi:hypothetical protein